MVLFDVSRVRILRFEGRPRASNVVTLEGFGLMAHFAAMHSHVEIQFFSGRDHLFSGKFHAFVQEFIISANRARELLH